MSLTELPYHLLIDHLLPLLPLSALLSFASTSKDFASVCADPIFWKRKLEIDFKYYPSPEIVSKWGFRLIYRAIFRPKIYIWGHLANGRRGVLSEDPQYGEAFPYPVSLTINKRIVSLYSGGWSFHALDVSGHIHVWGTLNGAADFGLPLDDPSFAEAGAQASTPLQLDLPTRFVSIGCGRAHSAALDIERRVWVFKQWGRPSLLTFTGSLDAPTTRHPMIADTHVVQVDCGYSHFVAFLTEDGRVFAMWLSNGPYRDQSNSLNGALNNEGDGYPAKAVNGIIGCTLVQIDAEPLLLPKLPTDLPTLRAGTVVEGPASEELKLVKIAAGNAMIIGLTNQGHILFIDVKGGNSRWGTQVLQEQFSSGESRWNYLPQFSELRQIIADPVFAPGEDDIPLLIPPTTLNITQISFHWESFIVLSTGASSCVLVAQLSRSGMYSEFIRIIYPALHERDIVSVAASESHFAALDANGTLLTWGIDQRGCLGLGELGRNWKHDWSRWAIVENPLPVQFSFGQSERKNFCFSMTAGGWHSGALLFDCDALDNTSEEKGTGGVASDYLEPLDDPGYTSSSSGSRWKKWKRILKGGTS